MPAESISTKCKISICYFFCKKVELLPIFRLLNTVSSTGHPASNRCHSCKHTPLCTFLLLMNMSTGRFVHLKWREGLDMRHLLTDKDIKRMQQLTTTSGRFLLNSFFTQWIFVNKWFFNFCLIYILLFENLKT